MTYFQSLEAVHSPCEVTEFELLSTMNSNWEKGANKPFDQFVLNSKEVASNSA